MRCKDAQADAAAAMDGCWFIRSKTIRSQGVSKDDAHGSWCIVARRKKSKAMLSAPLCLLTWKQGRGTILRNCLGGPRNGPL